MLPLTPSAVTTTFLRDKPFLLLNASAFDTRYVGSLLADGALKSKGGIALPPEIWLNIFDLVKLRTKTPEYHLARVLTATSRGENTTLSCEVDLSALTSPLACLDSAEEVLAIESYLAAPNQEHNLSFLEPEEAEKRKHRNTIFPALMGFEPITTTNPTPTTEARQLPISKFFYITVTDSDNNFLPHCLFHEVTVPDVIAHLQDVVCEFCEGRDGHTICPGCTGGRAQKFGAFMGCGVDLACPLCLGLDFMREDKDLLQAYYWDEMPDEEKLARICRFERRLDELGY